jgi:tRNA (guanine-N7-)-methyltransferase
MRQKPAEPKRPFYDDPGYRIGNPYLTRALEETEDRLVHPSVAVDRRGAWKEWTQSRPLHVEIGPGKGRFFRDYCLANPECVALAIEIKFQRMYKVSKKIKEAGIENGYMLRFDANYLTSLFASDEVDAIMLQFPDPWYKKARHFHNRMVTESFLAQLFDVLSPGGYFEIKTDHPLYFEEVSQLFYTSPFEIVRHTNDLHNSQWNEGNIETIFEEKFRLRGIKAHYLRAQKPLSKDERLISRL